MKFHFKKSQFRELKGADIGHSLNRDFPVQYIKSRFNEWPESGLFRALNEDFPVN